MHRRSFVALTSALSFLALPPVVGAEPALTSTVTDLLTEYEAAWNAGDAARMFRLATEDVHWVNIVGMHWKGRSEAELAHKVYLETMFRNVPLELEEVESITPVSADVLVVVARWSIGAFTPPDGAPVPASKDRMTLILVRTPEGLRIAHGANVQINPIAQQFDPAKGAPPARQ